MTRCDQPVGSKAVVLTARHLKRLLNLSLVNSSQNAKAMLKTYESLIYYDVHILLNNFVNI